MKLSRRPRVDLPSPISPRPESVHLITEYVLNLSIGSQAEYDVTPLYELCMNDARLGDFERQELTWVFMSLQLRAAVVTEAS